MEEKKQEELKKELFVILRKVKKGIISGDFEEIKKEFQQETNKDLIHKRLKMLEKLENTLEGKVCRVVGLESIESGIIISIDAKAMQKENVCPIAFQGLDIVTFMNTDDKRDIEKIAPKIFDNCK